MRLQKDNRMSAEIAVFNERKTCIGCNGSALLELSSGRFDEGTVKSFIDEDPWGEHPAPFLVQKLWSYVACANCGLAFHRFILDEKWNERRFSKWMSQEAIEAFEASIKTPEHAFNTAISYTNHVLQIEKLTRNIRGSQTTRLLDFGCGYGGFLAMCSLYGFEAYGVDRSAAKRDNNHFSNVFAEIEDIAHLAPFHALTLFEVLEHLDDPNALMIVLRDLLAKDGILVLETPDCSGINNIETRRDYAKIHPLEHINGFTPKTLTSFAKRLGFEPINKPFSCTTSSSTKVAKTFAKNLLKPILKSTTQLYFRKL